MGIKAIFHNVNLDHWGLPAGLTAFALVMGFLTVPECFYPGKRPQCPAVKSSAAQQAKASTLPAPAASR
jgi:hypothetical protein